MYSDFSTLIADRTSDHFYFIQVGANDGVTDDALRQHILENHWHGLLIEPLPDVFERLVLNYRGHDRLQFTQRAISSTDGWVTFYRHPSLPQCSGLGVKTRIQSRAKMEEIKVPSSTFETVLQRFQIKRLDLLQIDVEGYDAELLGLFPFDLITPLIVRYEHKHLKMEDRVALENRLKDLGYELFWEKNDTVAYRPI